MPTRNVSRVREPRVCRLLLEAATGQPLKHPWQMWAR